MRRVRQDELRTASGSMHMASVLGMEVRKGRGLFPRRTAGCQLCFFPVAGEALDGLVVGDQGFPLGYDLVVERQEGRFRGCGGHGCGVASHKFVGVMVVVMLLLLLVLLLVMLVRYWL